MGWSVYDWVYIIMNLFRTFIIYTFMRVFFDRKEKEIDKHRELFFYLAYYLFITAIYLQINIPIIMMLSNLIGFFLLSMNYKSSIKQRVFSVMYIYIIFLCVESIVVLLSGYINLPFLEKNNYSSIWGIVVIQILTYVLALFIQNYKNIKKGKEVPILYWISAVTIPSASVYIILILFYATGLTITKIFICIFLLLFMNIVIFSLYDGMLAILEEKMEKRMLLQQNNYYKKQFRLMKMSLATTGAVRHDLANHLLMMETLLQKNEFEKLGEYLSTLINKCYTKKEYAHSGNVVIDSILNFKLQEAVHRKINVQIEINVPEELPIVSFDMTIVLGNLLDNAINATSKLEEEKRKIWIEIRFEKGILIMKFKNLYNGTVVYHKNCIVSSEKDKNNHGIGLSNVKRTIEKYQGLFNIEHTEEVFSVTVMFFS